MMNARLVKDISAGTVQVICNQVLGVFIFIVISRCLEKAVYGELNWSLGVLTFITTILSLRLEQIVVKRIAGGENASKILSLFFGHILSTGLLFYFGLLAGSIVFPSFFKHHYLLLIIAISQLLSFFSLPFKQLANGKENFGWLAVMSLAGNAVKFVWLFCALFFFGVNITQVLVMYILSSIAELTVGIYLAHSMMKVRVSLRWALKDYLVLLTESIPQIGVVFLNACIARIDWILLGFFSTQVITAEYSFAYKMFELSPLPLLIVAPVLLSRFSKYFSTNSEASLINRSEELNLLIRVEMVLATLLPLILNMVWSPLMDLLTHNKYGSANQATFFILSCCIPLQYIINLLWTIHFSLNHLALIFKVTLVTFFVVVAGDLVMIPLFNAKGAALVYLIATLAECIIYLKVSAFAGFRNALLPVIVCVSAALISGLLVNNLLLTLSQNLLVSVFVYFIFLIITGQFKKGDIRVVKNWLGKPGPKLQTE